MLEWALTLLIIALAAAIVGFGGIAGAAVPIAKIIFYRRHRALRPDRDRASRAGRP